MLRRHSDNREIIIDNIEKVPMYATYLGVVSLTPDKILIYVNHDFPENIRESTVIHELLHVLLDHEGFPSIAVNEDKSRYASPDADRALSYIRDHFDSTIDHPQVFYREINEFDIDVDSYFDIQVKQKENRFLKGVERARTRKKKDKSYYFIRQQDILTGIDYYSYPSRHRKTIQEMFRSLYPEVFEYCDTLYSKLKFNNPKEVFYSAQQMKKDIIIFGEKNGLSEYNKIWDAMDILWQEL